VCWNLKKHTKTLGNPGRILPKHACQDFRILRAHFWYSCQDPARMQVSWQDPARIARILAGSWQSWRTHATSCGTRPAPPQKCMYLGQIWKVLIIFFYLRSMTRDNHTGMVKFYGSKSFGNILVKTSKSCQDPAEARPPLGPTRLFQFFPVPCHGSA